MHRLKPRYLLPNDFYFHPQSNRKTWRKKTERKEDFLLLDERETEGKNAEPRFLKRIPVRFWSLPSSLLFFLLLLLLLLLFMFFSLSLSLPLSPLSLTTFSSGVSPKQQQQQHHCSIFTTAVLEWSSVRRPILTCPIIFIRWVKPTTFHRSQHRSSSGHEGVAPKTRTFLSH